MIRGVFKEAGILGWVPLCIFLFGCASVPSARHLRPDELAILSALQETLEFQAQLDADPRMQAVSRNMAEALNEGRIQAFRETPIRPEVGGQVVGNRVFLREEWFCNEEGDLLSIPESLSDRQELTRLLSLLYVYVHEGVHTTQSPLKRFFRLNHCEREAYQVSHDFLNGLLRRKIGKQDHTDPLMVQIDQDLFLQVHGRCHALFDWEFLGPRCAEWTLDRFRKTHLARARERNEGFTLHRETPKIWRARFVRLGPNRWRARLPLPLSIEPVSRLGKPDEIDLAWVLIEPGGSEEVYRWNTLRGIQVERIGPTSSGQWRIDLLDTTSREGLSRYVTIVGIPLYTWFEPNPGPGKDQKEGSIPAMRQASDSGTGLRTK